MRELLGLATVSPAQLVARAVAEADCVDARRMLSETQQRLDSNDDQLSRSADGIEKVQRQRRDLIS